MRRHLGTTSLFIALLSALAFTADANAYTCNRYVTVDGAGLQDGTSLANAWTLDDANSNVEAGDVVCLSTGDYDTHIYPLDDGTSSSPIVYQAADGAVPRINDVYDCIRLKYDWIVVRGILCEGDTPSGFPDDTPSTHTFSITQGVNITNGSYNVVEDSTFRWIETKGLFLEDGLGASNYNVIRNNLFEFLGHPPKDLDGDGELLTTGSSGDEKNRPGDAIEIREGNSYNLVENNRVFKAGHRGIGIKGGGHHNIIRNNVVENPWWATVTLSNDAGATGDEGHFNVVSDNVVLDMAHTQEDLLESTNGGSVILWAPSTVVRNNLLLRSELEGISGSPASSWPENDGSRIYGNVIAQTVEVGAKWIANATSDVMDSTLFANNVFTENQTGDSGSDEQLLFDLEDGPAFTNDLGDIALRGNAILDSDGDSDSQVITIEGTTTGADKVSEVDADTGLVDDDGTYDLAVDNNDDAPGFLDAARDNLYLAWNSPQRDAGVHLAWTKSCSGSVITLEDDEDLGRAGDAVAFVGPLVTDVGSVELSAGDEIRIVGDPTVYEITDVDYADDEITVDQTVSCAAGRGVSLAWQGAAPDVGVYEGFVARSEIESSDGKDGIVIDGVIASYIDLTTNDPTVWAGDTKPVSGPVAGVRGVLSFDTSDIPSGVEILDARLELTRGLSEGGTDYADFGSLQIEIKSGGFGASTSLAVEDYDAAADAPPLRIDDRGTNLGDVVLLDVGRIGVGHPSDNGLDLINTSGATQFRLSFEKETDSNNDTDKAGFISGADTTGRAPLLLVTYVAPNLTEDAITSETGYVWPGVYTGSGTLNTGDSVTGDIVAIASFDTSSVPSGAEVLGAELQLEIKGFTNDPLGELGDLQVDVKEGYFGSSASLAAEDATATADGTVTIPIQGDAAGDAWSVTIPGDLINVSGKTQVRLQFDGTDGSSLEMLSFEADAELVVHYDPDGI